MPTKWGKDKPLQPPVPKPDEKPPKPPPPKPLDDEPPPVDPGGGD